MLPTNLPSKVVCVSVVRNLLLAAITLVAIFAGERTSSGQSPDTQKDLAAIEARAAAVKQEQYEIGSQLLDKYPDDFEALRIMGLVHSSSGNRAEMSECWLRCHQLKPDRADVCAQLAPYYMGLEKYDKAVEFWEKTLAIDPAYPGAQRQIGEIHLKTGRSQQAREALEAAIEADPKDGEAHLLLGQACYALQDFNGAKQAYETALEVNPEARASWRSKAWFGLIKTCGRTRDTKALQRATKEFRKLEAEVAKDDQQFRREFDDLAQIEQNAAITCIDAGKFYAQEGKFQRSEKLWQRAIELDPNNVTPHSLLAKLYLGQKKPAAALTHFKHLVRKDRGTAEVHNQIGFLEARLGNMQSAENAFKQAVAIAPESGKANRSLAKFYLNTNREPQRALKLAAKSVRLEPTAESYFVLGWSCAVNGKRAEANAALKKATDMKPDNPTYQKLYEMVRGQQ